VAYQVIWSPDSLSQLGEIIRFIANDNPPAAQRLADRIVDHVDLLAKNLREWAMFTGGRRGERSGRLSPRRIAFSIELTIPSSE